MKSPESERSTGAPIQTLLTLATAALGVFVLWIRFNAPPGQRGALFPHDLLYYFVPQMERVGARLAMAELPLWNPMGCAGLPLLAALQPAVFYPGTWLAAWLSPDVVLPLLTGLHLVLGAWGMAVLARIFGAAPIVAGALGVVFVFACAIGQTFWPPQVATIAWIPWLFVIVERAAQERWRPGWLALLSIATALQLLAGFPQHAVYGLQLLGLYALLRVCRSPLPMKTRIARLAALAAAVGLGVGLAAIQLVPTAELVAQSDRSESLTPNEVHYLSPRPRLQTLVHNAVAPEPRNPSLEIQAGTGYLGIATLILASAALVASRERALAWGLFACATLLLLLSDGYVGLGRSLYELYASLPGIGRLRAPQRMVLPAYLCVIWLAALGAAAFGGALRPTRGQPRDRRAYAALAAAVGAAATIAAVGSAGAAARAAATLAWLALAFALPDRAWARGLIAAGIGLLLVADVASVTPRLGSLRDLPSGWAEVLHVAGRPFVGEAELEELRAIAPARVEFVSLPPLPPVRPIQGAGTAGELPRLACYETLAPRQWNDLYALIHGRDFRSALLSNVDPRRYESVYDVASVARIIQLKARPGRLTRKLIGTRDGNFRNHARPSEPLGPGVANRVRTNKDALPRAYWTDRFALTPNPRALEQVLEGGYDFGRGVLLPPAFEETGLQSSDRVGEPVTPATIRSSAPELVVVEVTSPRRGVLVLTDTDFPGWRARVDGTPAAIYRANGLFRAVAVEAGPHVVEFEYVPESLHRGAVISGVSALLIAALAFGPASLRRRH